MQSIRDRVNIDMQNNIKICPICGAEHTNRRAKCCCIEHSKLLSLQKNKERAKPILEKICPKCGKHHFKKGVFCSRHCANGHIVSEETKQKISAGAIRHLESTGKKHKVPVARICEHCGQTFYSKNEKRFCSKDCRLVVMAPVAREALKRGMEVLRANGNLGGYREGSGRAKHGYYKGIYCGSTYELVWLIYQLDHGFPVERFPDTLEWNGVKYIPDFLQHGKIVELKGYEAPESVDRKTAVANHFGYEVIVLRKDDLKQEFKWVKDHHPCTEFQELYDDYKPKHVHICDCCGKEFSREHDWNNTHYFCSRQCAGRYMAGERSNGVKVSSHWWKNPDDTSMSKRIRDDETPPEGWVPGKWQRLQSNK